MSVKTDLPSILLAAADDTIAARARTSLPAQHRRHAPAALLIAALDTAVAACRDDVARLLLNHPRLPADHRTQVLADHPHLTPHPTPAATGGSVTTTLSHTTQGLPTDTDTPIAPAGDQITRPSDPDWLNRYLARHPLNTPTPQAVRISGSLTRALLDSDHPHAHHLVCRYASDIPAQLDAVLAASIDTDTLLNLVHNPHLHPRSRPADPHRTDLINALADQYDPAVVGVLAAHLLNADQYNDWLATTPHLATAAASIVAVHAAGNGAPLPDTVLDAIRTRSWEHKLAILTPVVSDLDRLLLRLAHAPTDTEAHNIVNHLPRTTYRVAARLHPHWLATHPTIEVRYWVAQQTADLTLLDQLRADASPRVHEAAAARWLDLFNASATPPPSHRTVSGQWRTAPVQ